MNDNTTIQELARVASAYMVWTPRDDAAGEYIYTWRDDRPDWCYDLACAVHHGVSDRLPDDYKYYYLARALEEIAEGEGPDDGVGDFLFDTDVYIDDLLAWAGSHQERIGYCGEALSDDFLVGTATAPTLSSVLMAGQRLERHEVWDLTVAFLRGLEGVT
jgi:hypothetical protein